MNKDRDLTVPKMTKSDVDYARARGLLASIPLAGPVAVEIFQLLVTSQYQRRHNEWMQNIADSIAELLKSEKLDFEKLSQDEAFTSAVMQAASVAIKTHHQEKREALRNAVLNVALKHSPDEALQHMFLRWIDDFSPMHLQLLKVAHNFAPSNKTITDSLSFALSLHFKDWKQREYIYVQAWKDLYSNGLVKVDHNRLGTNTSPSEIGGNKNTDLGSQFLKFIIEPPELAAGAL